VVNQLRWQPTLAQLRDGLLVRQGRLVRYLRYDMVRQDARQQRCHRLRLIDGEPKQVTFDTIFPCADTLTLLVQPHEASTSRGIQNGLAEVGLDPVARALGSATHRAMPLLELTGMQRSPHLQPTGCDWRWRVQLFTVIVCHSHQRYTRGVSSRALRNSNRLAIKCANLRIPTRAWKPYNCLYSLRQRAGGLAGELRDVLSKALERVGGDART
jgi:hypothetical protein